MDITLNPTAAKAVYELVGAQLEENIRKHEQASRLFWRHKNKNRHPDRQEFWKGRIIELEQESTTLIQVRDEIRGAIRMTGETV